MKGLLEVIRTDQYGQAFLRTGIYSIIDMWVGHIKNRIKNIQGFTLAELLASVAIIGVLILISIPSIASVQVSLRMTELDNAAKSIAIASQSQMTAKKVSGTWLDLIDKINEDAPTPQKAKALPGENDGDYYYLTAAQARANGILPRNSIDDVVYNGDFVIEFNKSTATVCGVFFTDGKQGFFDEQPSLGDNIFAQSYYLSMSSASARDEDARKSNSPLIGYYWGTPTGAAKTIALAKPIIYADEDGNLHVQNKELSKPDLNTSLDVTVTRVNDDGSEEPVFVLLGLQVFGNDILAYEITTPDRLDSDFPQRGIVVSTGKGIELIQRENASAFDVFKIDLNMISDLVKSAGSEFDDIKGILEGFEPTTNIRVDAKVFTNQKPCIPATATGFFQWPNRVASLSLLVTDPSHLNENDSYDGTPHIQKELYRAPVVELGFTSGGSSGPSSYVTEIASSFLLPSTDPLLTQANPASGYQAYSGGRFKLKDTDSSISTLNASVGSYNNHHYQIFELWLNDVQVGYLHDNKWVWTPGIGEVFGTCVTNLNANDSTLALETLQVDVRAFANLIDSGHFFESDGDYVVYVRTTPRIDEVNAYFTKQVNTSSNIHKLSAGNTGARGTNLAQNTGIRTDFEREFGSPSSASLWMIARETSTSGINDFPLHGNNDFRIYYVGTPALGFSTYNASNMQDSNGVPVTDYETSELHNAVMWYHERSGSGYTTHPQAMVIHPDREGVEPLHLTTAYAADFEIPFSRDYLYARVLFYNDENTNLIEAQYVPYSVQNEAAYATIKNRPYDKEGYTFKWLSPNTYLIDAPLTLPEGNLVGSHSAQLSYGRIDVNATYTEVSNTIGMVYYEYYSDGSTGVYGHTEYESPLINTLKGNEATITDWGYYVITPASNTLTSLRQGGLWGQVLSIANPSFVIDGISYKAYYPHASNNLKRQSFVNIEFCFNASNAAIARSYYSFNVNFAQMIEKDQATVASWGTTTAYPFYVRHADHFVGAMPEKWIQENFVDKVYRQTHDIDLVGLTISYGGSEFTGIYDGGSDQGYAIKNYEPKTANYSHYSVGLFGMVNGGTLQNVKIDYSNKLGDFTHNFTSGSDFAFGFLASIAYGNTMITNCSVEGIKNNGNHDHLVMNISTPSHSRLSVGGLVGRIDNATLTDCTVNGIDIKITSTLESWAGNVHGIGGIVGYVEGAESRFNRSTGDPSQKFVSEFSITGATNQSLGNATIYYGAIVGYKDGSATAVALDDSWYNTTTIERTISGAIYTFVEAIGRIPTSIDPIG